VSMGAPDGTGLEIAVVGMAGRFPGAATVEALWNNLAAGRESISALSDEDLLAAGVPAEEFRQPGYVPAYGVLDDVERFDAAFFGYSPRDAALLDPQQRLFLECSWEALEGAGHLVPAPGELVGVYAGAGMSSYLLHNLLGNPAVNATEYELLLGNDKDSLATRVAYHLDLGGPAVSVQTACSSSLVAVHLACQALLARECDVALTGGVHVRLPMRSGYRYETGGIMSRDGHCRPFDTGANGTVGGNGAGVVVLRRLADAVRDGDTVYAVVKGSATNNDGGVKVGFTAPGVDGQTAVIRMAQDVAEVDAGTIGYLESHGTATDLGDQIEFEALVRAFRAGTDAVGFCALGAAKALVGHLDVAAGVTGLIKACLALHHGVIPPNPYFTTPNPGLRFAGSPFYVNTVPVDWPDLAAPRRAAVSSFGIGGTNAHVVLQEAPEVPSDPSPRRDHLLMVSAPTEAALADQRRALGDRLRDRPDLALADVAATLQLTRRVFPHRLAAVCQDVAGAVAALSGDRPVAVSVSVEPATDRTVAFVFPGQGAQYVGMTHELYRTEPVFRRTFDECADMLRDHLDLDLRTVVHAAPGDADAAQRLQNTAVTQPALFTVEYALAQLWAGRGVRPTAMAGHSVGEYVAACLAGVFTLQDALAAVARRGRLMQAVPPGAMLSVALPAEELEALLGDDAALAAIAAVNAPRLSVVAGETAAIERLETELRHRSAGHRRLHTSHAFHSPMMEPVLEPLVAYLAGMSLSAPRLPVASGVTGTWLSAAEATDPAYWARQVRQPVRFADCAALLIGEDHTVLEVGPGTTLATLVRQVAPRGRAVVSSLGPAARPGPEGAAMANALARLWLDGAGVDWAHSWAPERRRRVSLPPVAFQRDRHWIDPAVASGAVPAAAPAAVDTRLIEPTTADSEPPAGPGTADASPEDVSPAAVIRRIWADLLGIDDLGPDDDFFALGGHSLLGTQVLARIRDALGVELPPGALFDAPTIARLTAVVTRLLANSGTAAPPAGEDGVPDLLAEILALSPDELREQLARERIES